jgi:anti-anti-sigma regulatory factor
MANGTTHDKFLAAIAGDTAYLIIRERATFKISPPFKRFCISLVESGVNCLVLDMRDCPGMDSTFMGVVAGLTVRLEKKDGVVMMINLSPHLRSLIATLGLDTLVDAHIAGEDDAFGTETILKECKPVTLEIPPSNQEISAKTMLDAHETLVQLLPENEEKFKDVLKYLREDLKKQRGYTAKRSGNPSEDS